MDERTIVSAAAAVKQVATPPGAGIPTPGSAAHVLASAGIAGTATPQPSQIHANPPPTPPPAPGKWKFVKNFTPADVFTFKDETTFSFPLIVRNDGAGYSSNSVITTTDEALANNLRGLTKNRATGVVEIKQ